ncbi:unnamed protein product, partial [Prorocentrum cordatum]
ASPPSGDGPRAPVHFEPLGADDEEAGGLSRECADVDQDTVLRDTWQASTIAGLEEPTLLIDASAQEPTVYLDGPPQDGTVYLDGPPQDATVYADADDRGDSREHCTPASALLVRESFSELPALFEAAEELLIMGANVNAWSSWTVLHQWIDEQVAGGGLEAKPHAFCLQETRLKSEAALISARSQAALANRRITLGKACSTGRGALESSGGVAVMAHRGIASAAERLDVGDLGHRICGRRLGAAVPGGVVLLSVYCEHSVGAAGNAELLERLARITLSLDAMWVIQADWNMTGVELEASGFVALVRGAEEEAGRTIDFFVMSQALRSCVRSVQALPEAPLHPHAPRLVKLAGLRSDQVVPRPLRFKAFCHTPLIGPKQDQLSFAWSWEAGRSGEAPLEIMVKEWFAFAEQTLVQDQGIEAEDAHKYIGRCTGPQLKQVRLEDLWHREDRGRFSSSTIAWISLLSLLGKAATAASNHPGPRVGAAPSSFRRGKGSSLLQQWKRKLLAMAEELDFSEAVLTKPRLLELVEVATSPGGWEAAGFGEHDGNGCSVAPGGPRARGLNESSALAGAAIAPCRGAAPTGGGEVLRRRARDATQRSQGWKAWVQKAAQGGGRLAHRYARRKDEDTGELKDVCASLSSLLQDFGRLGLPLSPGKSKYLASDAELDEQLQQAWAFPGSSRVLAMKALGTNRTLAARRSVAAQATREVEALRRSRRYGTLRRGGLGDAGMLQRMGASASALWGTATAGLADGEGAAPAAAADGDVMREAPVRESQAEAGAVAGPSRWGVPLAPEAAAAPVDTKHGAASQGSDAFGFGVDDFSEEMALAKEQPPENACEGSGPVGDTGPAGPAGGAAASPQSQEGRVPGHVELHFGLDDQVLARHAWRARGHALLRCRVAENPQMRFVFCLRCGGVLAGRKPGKLLKNWCRGRESSAGKEQLRLVRLLRWPHYGKGRQGGALEGPFALGPEEQLQLAGDLLLEGDLPAAASGGHRAAAGDERLPATPADAPGPQGRRSEPRAARLFVLRCYGLSEDDLEEVRRVGREAARAQAADASDTVSEEAELVG